MEEAASTTCKIYSVSERTRKNWSRKEALKMYQEARVEFPLQLFVEQLSEMCTKTCAQCISSRSLWLTTNCHQITSGTKVSIMCASKWCLEFWLTLQCPFHVSHVAAQHRIINELAHLSSVRWHYKEGFDVVFLEEGVPFVTISRLHLVISV